MWITILLFACSSPAPTPAPAEPSGAPIDPTPVVEAPRAAAPAPKANRAPEIASITFANDAPLASQNIEAVVTTKDMENDRIDLDFEWYVNDVRVVGVSSERLSGRYKKGDKVRATVIADDGANETRAESPVITIANTAPVVTTDPRKVDKADGFQFQATDADDDALKWRLEGAPAGMSITPSGKLSYKGSDAEPGGAYTVGIIVEDGDAWGRIDFPITVSPGSKAKK